MNPYKTKFLFPFFFLIAGIIYGQRIELDSETSRVRWLGRKVTGSHTGFLQASGGDIIFKNGILEGGNVRIDMNSITCTDIKDEKYNSKLVRHLKDPDFFSSDSFPESSFRILQATKIDNRNYLVKGDLMIKEIVQPYEFELNLEENEKQWKITGRVTIDRSKFNIRYKSSSFFDGLGDRMIYDDFDLDLQLIFKKPAKL